MRNTATIPVCPECHASPCVCDITVELDFPRGPCEAGSSFDLGFLDALEGELDDCTIMRDYTPDSLIWTVTGPRSIIVESFRFHGWNVAEAEEAARDSREWEATHD